jgi:putative transposase
MQKKIGSEISESSPMWETLDAHIRAHVQKLVQQLLEEEVTEYLGRTKSERRGGGERGYRNGYGKPRKLTLANGTIEVRRPRIRDLEARFESQILPLFLRRTREITGLLPELYLHGLALGDFELAMRGLLGQGAPLSPSTILRVKEAWQAEYALWQRRDLSELEVVYCWADGLYVKAGLEDGKAAPAGRDRSAGERGESPAWNNCADLNEGSRTAHPGSRDRRHARGGIRLDYRADERSLRTIPD